MTLNDNKPLLAAEADALAGGLAVRDLHSNRGVWLSRALDTGETFWLAMFAASAFGTNLGDFWVDGLELERPVSFASLVAICAFAICGDRRVGSQTELFYWTAIVALRAAATNLADFLTHDLALGYVVTSIVLGALALLAGLKTRSVIHPQRSPLIDAWYWIAMLMAGLFGTVCGDLTSHTIGLYAAAASLSLLLVLLLGARERYFRTVIMGYWCVVLAERCAATPVGDALASHRAVGLGLPLAMACTGSLFVAALIVRQLAAATTR